MVLKMVVKGLWSYHFEIILDQKGVSEMGSSTEMRIRNLVSQKWESRLDQKVELRYSPPMSCHVGMKIAGLRSDHLYSHCDNILELS